MKRLTSFLALALVACGIAFAPIAFAGPADAGTVDVAAIHQAAVDAPTLVADVASPSVAPAPLPSDPTIVLDQDLVPLFGQLFVAMTTGNLWLGMAIGLLIVLLGARKYIQRKVPFFGTLRGTALLVLVASTLLGLINALLAPGVVFGLPLLFTVVKVTGTTLFAFLVKAFFLGDDAILYADAKGRDLPETTEEALQDFPEV